MLTGVLNSLMLVVIFFLFFSLRFLWVVLGQIYVTAKIENRKEKRLWCKEGSLTKCCIVLVVMVLVGNAEFCNYISLYIETQ